MIISSLNNFKILLGHPPLRIQKEVDFASSKRLETTTNHRKRMKKKKELYCLLEDFSCVCVFV